jgi:hypothetical protein
MFAVMFAVMLAVILAIMHVCSHGTIQYIPQFRATMLRYW